MPFIEAKDISFSYSNGTEVIKEAGVSIENGEFTGLIGPNGSGKTTIGKLLCGILMPDKGNIFLDKEEISNLELCQIGQVIGYLFQNPDTQIFNVIVKKELSFILELKGFKKSFIDYQTEKMLNLFKLSNLRDSYTFNLSYGEKKRLAIASILINKPKFLILDEPTTGLDIKSKKMLSNILKKLLDRGIGMLVMGHDEDFIKEMAGRTIKIREGRIIG